MSLSLIAVVRELSFSLRTQFFEVAVPLGKICVGGSLELNAVISGVWSVVVVGTGPDLVGNAIGKGAATSQARREELMATVHTNGTVVEIVRPIIEEPHTHRRSLR